MKTVNSQIFCLGLVVLSLVCLPSCVAEVQKIEYIQTRRLSPEIISESGKAKMFPAGFIKRRLRLGYPSLENIIIGDRQYLYITEKWFLDVVKWVEEFIALRVPNVDIQKKMPLAYPGTFAALASNTANIAVAKRYNLRASVLIGVMRAKSGKPWGAIPANGKYRSYLVALTEKGGIVYDLKTKQMTVFEQFPNLEFMDGIAF